MFISLWSAGWLNCPKGPGQPYVDAPGRLARRRPATENQVSMNVRTLTKLSFFETLECKEAREMYFRNFSVKVIQGPHRERSFALDRIYQVLAVHFENTELNKTYVLLEDDSHSLQWVPSNEVKVNTIE